MKPEEKVDSIKEICNQIQPGKVTVLTGKNGSGKSLVRKLLAYYIAEKLGKEDPKGLVNGVSMQSRTQKKYEFSALSSLGIDDPANPTGLETIDNNILPLFKSLENEGSRFLVIDEPEIGAGEELVAAIVNILNDLISTTNHNGVLIITHNRYVVNNLKVDLFINMEGMSKDEWLNRPIIPTNIQEFKDESLALWRYVESKSK
jgi:ABC-type dipeptide/oligopeptide/nickel transport system ATPase component